jgi:hypothetical protein
MTKLYELLRDHYVEDDDNKFRFEYPREFLEWTLKIPNYKMDENDSKKISDFLSFYNLPS